MCSARAGDAGFGHAGPVPAVLVKVAKVNSAVAGPGGGVPSARAAHSCPLRRVSTQQLFAQIPSMSAADIELMAADEYADPVSFGTHLFDLAHIDEVAAVDPY